MASRMGAIALFGLSPNDTDRPLQLVGLQSTYIWTQETKASTPEQFI